MPNNHEEFAWHLYKRSRGGTAILQSLTAYCCAETGTGPTNSSAACSTDPNSTALPGPAAGTTPTLYGSLSLSFLSANTRRSVVEPGRKYYWWLEIGTSLIEMDL